MRLVLILLIVFFVSCNSNSSKSDTDSVLDKDSSLIDLDNIKSDIDTSVIDLDIIDTDTSQDINEFPDTDADCLDLRYNENTIKTGFPFKDKNGKPTFCRPGCDTPTETDPQCVRNIWEWENWGKYQEYLAAEKKDPDQIFIRECYPWPCVLPEMKGRFLETMISKCDKMVSGYGYTGGLGDVWTHGMSNGVAGMLLEGCSIEYNPVYDEYTKVALSYGLMIFNENRYIMGVFDSVPGDNPEYRAFVVSAVKKEGKYFYELIYDNKIHNAYFSRPPFVGKDWVLIQVCEGKDGLCDVKYAKAGVWEWHSLNIGKVQEGNIVDDRLTFIINDGVNERQIFYCDMSKYPKSFNDCIRVTRKLESEKYELGHSPRIDENNKNRLIYYIDDSVPHTIVEFKYSSDNNHSYRNIEVDRRFQTEKVSGNILLYTTGDEGYFINCWYRFDKNREYCPEKGWSTTGARDMFYGTFSDKWHLWRSGTLFLIRDWDCYCKEEGVCPFEE